MFRANKQLSDIDVKRLVRMRVESVSMGRSFVGYCKQFELIESCRKILSLKDRLRRLEEAQNLCNRSHHDEFHMAEAEKKRAVACINAATTRLDITLSEAAEKTQEYDNSGEWRDYYLAKACAIIDNTILPFRAKNKLKKAMTERLYGEVNLEDARLLKLLKHVNNVIGNPELVIEKAEEEQIIVKQKTSPSRPRSFFMDGSQSIELRHTGFNDDQTPDVNPDEELDTKHRSGLFAQTETKSMDHRSFDRSSPTSLMPYTSTTDTTTTVSFESVPIEDDGDDDDHEDGGVPLPVERDNYGFIGKPRWGYDDSASESQQCDSSFSTSFETDQIGW